MAGTNVMPSAGSFERRGITVNKIDWFIGIFQRFAGNISDRMFIIHNQNFLLLTRGPYCFLVCNYFSYGDRKIDMEDCASINFGFYCNQSIVALNYRIAD